MFCENCGKEIPESTKFCPYCGNDCSKAQQFVKQAQQAFGSAEQELESAFDEVKQSFTGNNANQQYNNQQYGAGQQYNNQQYNSNPQFNYGGQGYNQAPPPYTGERLKDDRGIVSYILLSLITCGIYGYYFIYKMAHDVNIACDGDGESTSGLAAFILLSIVTCGIYSWIWYYKLGNRLSANAGRYGLVIQENGTTVLMWLLFGALLCGIGPFIAMYILIKNSNMICNAYNRTHGLM